MTQFLRSPTHRERPFHPLDSRLLRLGVVVALAVTIWSSGLVVVESRLLTGARWVADHSGATWASEAWRTAGRPRVDHAVTAGYQNLRQLAMTVFDYVDVSTPTNRTVEKLEKLEKTAPAADPAGRPSEEIQRGEDSKQKDN